MSIEGKTVLVTGANRGIGQAPPRSANAKTPPSSHHSPPQHKQPKDKRWFRAAARRTGSGTHSKGDKTR